MAIVEARTYARNPETVSVSAAQTGTGPSTNVVDRGPSHKGGIVRITTVAGATPTVTVALEVSADNSNWVPATYADSGTPNTDTTASLVITTSTTTSKLIKTPTFWRYFRLNYSANTNVTITADFLYDDSQRPPWS